MGETDEIADYKISDDCLSGACCSWCSQYFVNEHGYPVLCTECFNHATKDERGGYLRAIEKEIQQP